MEGLQNEKNKLSYAAFSNASYFYVLGSWCIHFLSKHWLCLIIYRFRIFDDGIWLDDETKKAWLPVMGVIFFLL